jgi:putative membrane protein
MMRAMTVWIVTATVVAFIPATGMQSAKQETKSSALSFIEEAAEGQQVEIALGQLAIEQAGDEQVKRFGSLMVEDHQKAKQEVEQLASKEGVQLPTQLAGKHKQDRFSRLSGKEFDQAYMTSMLRDHRKDVKEFEQGVHALKNPLVREWAERTLPVLKQHLQKAQQIATSIGINQNTVH